MQMTSLENVLTGIDSAFREALMYFFNLQGQEISWPSPSPIAGLPYVVSQGKGIYKPESNINTEEIALSVRQNLSSKYGDMDPVYRDDGTWVYAYHHEGTEFESSYTNYALKRNIDLRRPVVVLRQVKEKPGSLYRVEGVALVVAYLDGFFYLEGFNQDGLAHEDFSNSLVDSVSGIAVEEPDSADKTPIDLEHDARQQAMRSIVQRQGQSKFRKELLYQYQSKCAISECGVEYVLDAAHILPYNGPHTNELANGLLLRTDLHNLFDLGLLAIDPEKRCVLISKKLEGSEYATFHGQVIAEPVELHHRPTELNLRKHFHWCVNICGHLLID